MLRSVPLWLSGDVSVQPISSVFKGKQSKNMSRKRKKNFLIIISIITACITVTALFKQTVLRHLLNISVLGIKLHFRIMNFFFFVDFTLHLY
jgi:hypothetical protein